MKGYYTANGFFGFVDGGYTYFASQSDYYNEMENGCSRNMEFDYYCCAANYLQLLKSDYPQLNKEKSVGLFKI